MDFEAIRKFPEPREIHRVDLSSNDIFIMCAGFEERSVGVLRLLPRDCAFQFVGIDYLPLMAENRREEMQAWLSHASATARWFVYNREDPEGTPFGILRDVVRSGPLGRIVLDVSGMSRLMIVQFIAAAADCGVLERVVVLYTEAESYGVDQSLLSTKGDSSLQDDDGRLFSMVSSGVIGLTVVAELSSVAMLGQPVHLVFFPTWNTLQMSSTCIELQAGGLSIVLPRSHDQQLDWMAEALKILNKIDSRNVVPQDIYSCSVVDYRETLEALTTVYERYGLRSRLIISPTGSKMQSVAVGIFKVLSPDVQVVYPTPLSFPSPATYTTGCKAIWSVSLSKCQPEWHGGHY